MTIDQSFIDMIKRQNFVVIDVETTGKEHYDVICEIAILNQDAQVLLHTKVDPMRPISPEASRIHGITDDDVKNMPSWGMVAQSVIEAIKGKDVVVWNEKHERMLFHRSDETAGCRHMDWKSIGHWFDAMVFYAELWGEPNDKYPNAKWQSLGNAIRQQGIEPGLFHSALGDTFMTLNLVTLIAAHPEQIKTFVKPEPAPKQNEVTYDVKRIVIGSEKEFNELARLLSLGYQVQAVIRPYCDSMNTHCCNDEVFLTKKL